MVAEDSDQPAPYQERHRILDGATRQAGRGGDAAMAGARTAALRTPSFRPEMHIHEKCRRATVMACEVAHEYIHNVVIEAQVGSHAHILL